MYIGAQRVDDDTVTLYLYLHLGLLRGGQVDLLKDVRWVSAAAPGLLAREQHAGWPGGRRILSYLEISGPDETTGDRLREILDRLSDHVQRRQRSPLEVGSYGAQFFCQVPIDQVDAEFTSLRGELEAFFGATGTQPPTRALTIDVTASEEGLRFRWSGESRDTLLRAAPDWQPTSLGIDDDVRDAFQQQYGTLYPHVLGIIKPDVDLVALGGVQFVAAESGRVLWFSPAAV